MTFWTSPNGEEITGDPKKAFIQDFSIIPDGTTALAEIKSFVLIQKESEYLGHQKYYEIIWKITSNDFKNREVTQKIKAFAEKPEQVNRALNMMKLVMDLCKFKPAHSEAPINEDLKPMFRKVLGIKIREWSMPKNDGTGMMFGNTVSEVHDPKSSEFSCEIGVKIEPVIDKLDSAFSRNATPALQEFKAMQDDIPF